MVKRLRLSPLTAATRVRIPAESPLRRIGMRRFCLPGFSPGHLAFRKVLPGARRVPRHFRVSSSPIGARCKANPGRVPRGGGKVVTRCFFRLSQVAFRVTF